jgi:hypothetical protein
MSTQTKPELMHDANSAAVKIVKPLISSDAKERVERIVKQTNQPLRKHIRDETGLNLHDGTERHSIPVKVREGFTGPFGDIIIRHPDPLLWWLIFGMGHLDGIIGGTEWLLSRWSDLEHWPQLPPIARGAGEALARTQDVAIELQRLAAVPPIIEEIRKITKDYLGAYFWGNGRTPWIEIYWMPIALIATRLKLQIEDLAVVVLTHELAHGYTHIGCDIGGASWDTQGFGKSDDDVIEGLAQFYTDVVTQKAASRVPNAHRAYLRFLEMQSGPYLAHQKWIPDTPEHRAEAVRFTLLAARAEGVVKHDYWLTSLVENHAKLKRNRSRAQNDTLL